MRFVLVNSRTSITFLGVLLVLLGIGNAHADWRSNIPDARVMGQGNFSWFGLTIYSAQLWAAQSENLYKQSFALQLTYQRDVSRERLVKSSIDEIRRVQGRGISDDRLRAWTAELDQAFADVSAGEQIVGVHLPGVGSRFYVNGQLSHTVADTDFSQAFFAIWLDPKTRSPTLRRALLGLE